MPDFDTVPWSRNYRLAILVFLEWVIQKKIFFGKLYFHTGYQFFCCRRYKLYLKELRIRIATTDWSLIMLFSHGIIFRIFTKKSWIKPIFACMREGDT